MSKPMYDEKWNVVGHISDDGKTHYDKDWNVVGHTSDDGKKHFDKDWNVAGHTSADGKTHYDSNWDRTGRTSKDGKTHYDKDGNVSGHGARAEASGTSWRVPKILVPRLPSGRDSEMGDWIRLGIVYAFYFAVIVFVLMAFLMLLMGVVLLGFIAALAAAYQLYLEKKQPGKFQSQKWLREGLPTRWLPRVLIAKLPGAGHLRYFESPRRAGLILGIASAGFGIFVFISSFGEKQSSPDWIASFIPLLILLSQGIFLIWAGRHFSSICDATQSPHSDSAVPPPLQPPPLPNA